MELLCQSSRWLADYINGFKTKDSCIRKNIDLKEEHTEKVVIEAISLARALNWPEEDICLAGLIARFHDLARFEQFSQYRTFKDKDSRDHGDWGIELIEKLNPLPQLIEEDRRILLSAIRFHNKKSIPKGIAGRELQHCRLIRDADKIDIYRVATQLNVSFEGFGKQENTGKSPYIPLLVDNLLKGIQSDNTYLRSREELILLQLGWIFDLNYTESLRKIEKRGYLNQLINELPYGQDRIRIERYIQQTVEEKCSLSGSRL